jgi:iron complex transport system permease protein
VPADAEHVLLVADETGFAAAAALLDVMPPGCRVTAVLETVGASHRPALPDHPHLTTVWVDRGPDDDGATNRLLAAVRGLQERPDAAFGAGESRQISEVRRHVGARADDRVLASGARVVTAAVLMAHDAESTHHRGRVGARRAGLTAVLALALVAATVASLAYGAKPIPIGRVIASFTSFDGGNTDHLVVRELRLPRTIVGLLVGAALGVSGAVMQAVTRNPLADPGLLGVNAGASFAVVLAIWAFDVTTTTGLVWFALAGAAIAAGVVYALGSVGRGAATPVRLALSGAALSALLFALTRAVTLLDEATLDQFRFWGVGSLSGRDANVVRSIVWFVVGGLVLAAGLARSLDAIGLGDDVAVGLGVRVAGTRAAAGVAIVLLCGAAVAAVGPIAFVGLVVPHAVRAVVGPDQRWLMVGCALAGPALLLACDTLGRLIARPGEVQVGIMTAAVGGPAFVLLVRRARVVQL